MTPHAFASSPPATSRVVTTTRFGRGRRPARPAAPPRTRLTPINPLAADRDVESAVPEHIHEPQPEVHVQLRASSAGNVAEVDDTLRGPAELAEQLDHLRLRLIVTADR